MKKRYIVFLSLLLIICATCFLACNTSCNGGKKFELSIIPGEITLTQGALYKLEYKAESDGYREWKSSDYDVVNVYGDGEIYAVAPGEASITLKVMNATANVSVKVVEKENEEQNIKLDVSVTAVALNVGQEFYIKVALLKDGEEVLSNITFSSGDNSVAAVSPNGKITAHAKGKTIVTVRTEYGGIEYSSEVFVGVKENIVLALSEVSVEVDDYVTDIVVGKLSCEVFIDGKKQTNPEISWSVLNEEILSVNSEGGYSAKRAGKACVKAKYVYNGTAYEAVSTINVNYKKEVLELAYPYVKKGEKIASLELPAGVDVRKLEKFVDANKERIDFSVKGQILQADSNDFVYGRNDYYIYDDMKEYKISVYAADYVLSTITDYENMMEYGTNNQNNSRSGYVVMTNDIDMSGKEYFYKSNQSTTTFDLEGNGYAFRNGTTNGFFANVMGGNYRNIAFINTEITSKAGCDRGGSFANTVGKGAIVKNVAVINPTIASSVDGAGMLCGRIYSAKTTFSNILTVDLSGIKQPDLFGIAERVGASADKSEYYGVYCISSAGYDAFKLIQAKLDVAKSNYGVIKNFSELKTIVGSDISSYTLLDIKSDGAYICGIKIA